MAPFDRSSPLCESVQQLAKGVPHTGPHRSPRYLNDQIFQFGIHHGVERNHRAPFPSSLFSFHLSSSSSSSFSFSSIPSPSTEACVSFRRLFGYFSSLSSHSPRLFLFSSVANFPFLSFFPSFLRLFASSPNAATLRFILFFLLLVVVRGRLRKASVPRPPLLARSPPERREEHRRTKGNVIVAVVVVTVVTVVVVVVVVFVVVVATCRVCFVPANPW